MDTRECPPVDLNHNHTPNFFNRLTKCLAFSFMFLTCGIAVAQDEEDVSLDIANSFDYKFLGGELGRLEPHGNDLMGDMIDKKTGSMTLEHTDISIPGNSGLEVAIRRKHTQGAQYIPHTNKPLVNGC